MKRYQRAWFKQYLLNDEINDGTINCSDNAFCWCMLSDGYGFQKFDTAGRESTMSIF